ncbi:hypothetical protein HY994_04155 [Candidatus Micrarchaeota archaeon]|nr:hypothetical protein [Candidatus Micrarchaeota archaeon]
MFSKRHLDRPPLSVVFLVLFLSSFASALSFSGYAFLFPDVPVPNNLASCSAFEVPVALTGRAAMDSGFEQGVAHGQDAVRLWSHARQLAQFQRSPLLWFGVNPVLNKMVSLFCHRFAAQALQEAVFSVNSNWAAVDQKIAELEYAGVSMDGPTKGKFQELDQSRLSIENRTTGADIGGRFVAALQAVQDAPHRDDGYAEGMAALVGPDGVLDMQFQARRDIARVLQQSERDYADDVDRLTQRLEEGQRLHAQLDVQKIGLVSQFAFSLQKQSDYARTGFVQSFPQTLQSALDHWTDGGQLRAEAEKVHAAHAAGYLERQSGYLSRGLESTDTAASLWQLVDRQTQVLESDLVSQLANARDGAKRALGVHSAVSLDVRLQLQKALDLSERPLPATRGERILQLADAMQSMGLASARLDSDSFSDALASRMDALKVVLAHGKTEGLDLAVESSQLEKLAALAMGLTSEQANEQADAVRESVISKATERYGRLESVWKTLAPYAAFVTLDVPAFDADGHLMVAANLGHLKELETQLENMRQTVDKNKGKWLADYLQTHLDLHSSGESMVLDQPANRTFVLGVTNGLDFGSEGPILLKRPVDFPDGGQVVSSNGIRLLPDGLLLEKVDAQTDYSVQVLFQGILAHTKSVTSETRYATLQSVRRSTVINFQSDVEGAVWFQRNLGVPVQGVVSDIIGGVDVAVDNDTVRGVLAHVNKGTNNLRLEYDVPNAVHMDKTAVENQWRYALQSHVPFELDLPLALDEFVACAPTSKDFSIAPMSDSPVGSGALDDSDGLFRFSANVTLHAFEQKNLSVQLDCMAQTLGNQSALLSLLPGLPQGSDAVLVQVRNALKQGAYSEATWLLSQLQQPSYPPSDSLAKFRSLRDVSPSFSALLERAEAAQSRGDPAALQGAVRELDALLRKEKSALEEQIKALCTQCPSAVEQGLHQAKSALFLDQLPQARNQLASAQLQFQQWLAESQKQNQTLHDLLDPISDEKWPALSRFDLVWTVSEPATKWRNRQSGYVEGKTRYDALQKGAQKLADFKQKSDAGKTVALAELNAALDSARRLASELDAVLDREQTDATATVDAVQKAFQQFGTPALQVQLDALLAALDEGRFGAAQYLSESLSAQLQRAPAGAGQNGGAVGSSTGLLGAHSGLEWAAGLGGLAVIGGFVYWVKTKKVRV